MSDHPSADIIVAEGLGKAFGLRPVLRGLSFRIARGSTTALLGPNGSGKTTLLRILTALSTPTAGKLTIGGWSLPKEAATIRAQLGFVGHLPLLYDDLTAEENLRFFGHLYNLEKPPIAAVLERVGLAKRGRDLVRTFSRGMQQRLAIGRAMLHEPAIFLLDEPYTGLDVNGFTMLDRLLSEWKAAGRTIIISLHEVQRAAVFCDHALILNQGKLAANTDLASVPDLPGLFVRVTT